MYTRQNPSARYRELTTMYRTMHAEGEKFLGIPPEKTFPGQSLLPQGGTHQGNDYALWRKNFTRLRRRERYAVSAHANYRRGHRRVAKYPDVLGVDEIYCYDPAYTPFNQLPNKKFDGVISTDVLEHCPEEDIPWILDEIFGYATRFVFANVACYPAKKRLPNGENAHCTIREPEWWQRLLSEVSSKHAGIKWEVWVQYQIDTPRAKEMIEKRFGN